MSLVRPRLGAIALTALLVLGSLLGAATPTAPHAARVEPGSVAFHGSVAAPVGRIGHLPMALPRPSASHEFYTQVGATLSEINATFSASGVTALSEVIPLVVSPYPIGYELNLLSNTGDWYQVVVGDNWPGCNPGFEEIIEVWDSVGNSGPVNCDPSVSLSKGNLVELNGSFDGTSNACLGLNDLSTHRSHVVCQTQPDTGGSQYDFLQSAANGDGYYTGTMTEIVNQSATSCPDYKRIPTVTFDFPTWAHITEFVPWSDEWDNVPSGSFCYSSSGPPTTLPGPSPASHYIDASGGSSDGPREVQGQNDTLLNASVGFRFQSDPKPLTGESLTTSGTILAPGGTVTLASSTSGGVAPYGTLWEFDGAFASGHSGSGWNYSTSTPGNYTFVAFGTDAQGDAIASPTVLVRVPFPLTVGTLSASTGSGADAGQAVTFTGRASGGIPPLTYDWAGLPNGCASSNATSIGCTPASAGNASIVLSVTDANGSTVRSPPFSFVVSPRLVVAFTASRTVADIGLSSLFRAVASGGSGGLAYAWAGLPTGCSSGGASANCTLTATGESVVTVTVRDANHVSVSPAAIVLVVNPLLTVSLSASSTTVDVGHSITITTGVFGGSGGARFAYAGLPAGCVSADTPSIRCVPTNSSTFPVEVAVTDLANATVNSLPVDVTVYPALSLKLVPNTTVSIAPASISISPSVTGGSNLVRIQWSKLPSGCVASGLTPSSLSPVHCHELGIGNYTISLRIDDVGLGNATATVNFSVSEPASPPPSVSVSSIANPLDLAILVIVVAVVAVALGLRRKGAPPRR